MGSITSFDVRSDVRSIENPAVPLSAAAIDEDYGLTESSSVTGVKVSRNRVLGYSAVWRAVNLIAGDVGRLPIGVFRRGPDGRTPDRAHPAAVVLRRPNEYMTPVVFRRTIQAHALLDGNGYAVIIRGVNAEPLELLPLDPRRTWPVRANGCLWYVSEVDEPVPGKRRRRGMVKLLGSDVIHIPGLGYDGLCGYPVIKILRETFGTALAARDYGSRYFATDAQPGVVLEVPAGMKETAVTNLRQSWESLHKGIKNAHRMAILRDGVKATPLPRTNARDAQLLENRSFDAREIANVFGVPAHKLGDPSRTAYNSLESENQSYLDDTLDGWLTVWEQECGVKLLTEFEKQTGSHDIEFNRRALVRTNLSERGTYYSQALAAGWMNPDEVREEEGRNPIPDGSGKTYTRPVNVAPVGQPAPASPPPPPAPDPTPNPAPDAGRSDALRAALRAAAIETAGRMVRRFATHAARAAGKKPAEFRAWAESILDDSNEHVQATDAALAHLVAASRAMGRTPGPHFGRGLAAMVRSRCLGLVGKAADLPAAVARDLAAMEQTAAAIIADDLFPEKE